MRTEGIRTQEDAASIHGRDVHFAGPAGVLGGSLQLPPQGVDPQAVVVFLHGSGPQDRDENSPGAPLQIFNAFAGDCAAAGLASIRYDKRGVGASAGELLEADVHDLAGDGLAAVRFARRLHETAGLPVFLLGHSEGTILAMLIATRQPDLLAGLVLLAPALTPMEALLRRQAAAVQQAIAALPPAERQELGIPPGFDQREATEALIVAVREAAAEQPVVEFLGQPVPARWFRSHFELDLGALAEQVRCPTLVVGGSKDAQVPPRDAQALADRMRQAAAGGETPDVQVALLPDLTHILRRSDGPGDPSEYAALAEQPVDLELRALVRGWLAEHLPPPPAEPQP